MRAQIAQRLKVHEEREFLLLAALGYDLPGGVVLAQADTPDHLRRERGAAISPAAEKLAELKFSLGGMQMKFSMLRQGEPFYAIRRFDRPESGRTHVEDFAQVFNLHPSQKYGRVNYDMIALALVRYAGGLPDLKEMSRRLVLNVLLGNGDAHIKNWSLIYLTPTRPRLAPAYDLVATMAYTTHDKTTALNMAGIKRFDAIDLDTFAALFARIGLHDQVRDDLMEEIRSTSHRVLAAWQQHFAAAGVPDHLTRRVEAHIRAVPLSRA